MSETENGMSERPPDDIVTVQRCLVTDIAPGDLVWWDEIGDWMKIERVWRPYECFPAIWLHGQHVDDEVEHKSTDFVLRRVGQPDERRAP